MKNLKSRAMKLSAYAVGIVAGACPFVLPLAARADADLDAFSASTTLGIIAAKQGIFTMVGNNLATVMYIGAGIIGFFLLWRILKRMTGR